MRGDGFEEGGLGNHDVVVRLGWKGSAKNRIRYLARKARSPCWCWACGHTACGDHRRFLCAWPVLTFLAAPRRAASARPLSTIISTRSPSGLHICRLLCWNAVQQGREGRSGVGEHRGERMAFLGHLKFKLGKQFWASD